MWKNHPHHSEPGSSVVFPTKPPLPPCEDVPTSSAGAAGETVGPMKSQRQLMTHVFQGCVWKVVLHCCYWGYIWKVEYFGPCPMRVFGGLFGSLFGKLRRARCFHMEVQTYCQAGTPQKPLSKIFRNGTCWGKPREGCLWVRTSVTSGVCSGNVQW